MKPNILLVSYNFPPIMNPRSLRWIQFTRYLVKKGYNLDVLTVDPRMSCRAYDEASPGIIPMAVNVHRTYTGVIHRLNYWYWSPEKIRNQHYKNSFEALFIQELKKICKGIAKPILIPGETIERLLLGLRMAKKIISKNHYDLIISSAMPFTDHILACFVKKWTAIPWIADYGDPLAFNPVSPEIKWEHLGDKWIESKLLEAMDCIIVTTDETKKGFIEYYPFLKKGQIAVIPQGYSPEEFEGVQPELGNKFRIVYTGIFYDDVREPYTFFDAIKHLKDIELEVIVAGYILPHYIKAAEENNIRGKIIFLGPQPHKRAIALQKGADLLLLFGWLKGYQIPGKIFEYFGACRPILCITFDEKDIAGRLIRKYNRGMVVSNNGEEIASAVRKLYGLWHKRKLNEQFWLEPTKEYSWESQAKKLENVIRNCVKF